MKEFHHYTYTEQFRDLLISWGFSGKISNYVVDFFGLFVVSRRINHCLLYP